MSSYSFEARQTVSEGNIFACFRMFDPLTSVRWCKAMVQHKVADCKKTRLRVGLGMYSAGIKTLHSIYCTGAGSL